MPKYECQCGYIKKEDELTSVFMDNHREHMMWAIKLYKVLNNFFKDA